MKRVYNKDMGKKILLVLIIVGLASFLVVCITGYLNNKTQEVNQNALNSSESQEPSNVETVPLPTKEDAIRLFFSLINEKRIPEAVEMLTEETSGDEAQKQTWAVQFDAIESVSVKNITEESENVYKVLIDVKMDPEAVNAVIPYFGYNDGLNTRWVTVEKAGLIYKIGEIATGR